MNSEIRSHPDRLLHRHLREVEEVAWLILDRHSAELFRAIGLNPKPTMSFLAGWHDIAKGTEFFQDYIADPEEFQRRQRKGEVDPLTKSHTELGALLAFQHALHNTLSPHLQKELYALLLALVIRGHHNRLPCLKDLLDSFEKPLLKEQFDRLSPQVEQCHPTLAGAVTALKEFNFEQVQRSAAWGLEDIRDGVDGFLDTADALSFWVRFRLAVQFCFSCLLEADKALLIHQNVPSYLGKRGKTISGTIVEDHPIEVPVEDAKLEINVQRKRAFQIVIDAAENCDLKDLRPRLLTLPTGLGKTRCAAGWAFHLRDRIEQATTKRPKIFIVLPFLSIIEQTAKIYRQELRLSEADANDNILQLSHSLSARDHQDLEDPNHAEFALDTWKADVVLTTFDQFLLSLMNDRTRHQQRFHNLCDAIVVLDEVQGFPCRLWHPVGTLMWELAEVGRTRFLLMTATQPALFEAAARNQTTPPSPVPIIENPTQFARNRYRMQINLSEQDFEEWLDRLPDRIRHPEQAGIRKWLIVLNTRRSAQRVYQVLQEHFQQEWDLFLLSSDIVPCDRLERIQAIKDANRCLAVTTQCVEAGVDLDMDYVIRDLAPLDSLVQAAGRCNRNGRRDRSIVEIIRLRDQPGIGGERKSFGSYIYDPALLLHTLSVLRPYEQTGLNEEDVTRVVEQYFQEIVQKSIQELGRSLTEQWARFDHEDIRISQLLRGDAEDQVQFVVLKKSPGLRQEIESAWSLKDRWERRRRLRNLAPKIASVTVSAWKKKNWQPRDLAEPFPEGEAEPVFWFLNDEAYHEELGLCPQQMGGKGCQIF